MIKYLVLASVVLSALASVSLVPFQARDITLANVECLKQKGYLEQTYIQVTNIPGIVSSIDDDYLQKLSIKPHAILFLAPFETFSPDYGISTWTHHLLTHEYQSLWISWTMGGGFKVDCLGVWKIYAGLQKLVPKMGIFMNLERWEDNAYLNYDYCLRLNQFPLFVDEVDFKPFHGWTDYALKYSAIVEGVCDVAEVKVVTDAK